MAGKEAKEGFWRPIGAVLRSAWEKFPGLIAVSLFLAVVAGVMQAVSPKLLQMVIDLLIANPHIGAQDEFWKLVLWLTAASALAVLATYFASKVSFYIATQTEDHWRYRALRHFYMLPIAWHDEHDSGEIGWRIDRGGAAVYSLIQDVLGQSLFISSVTFVIVLAAAIYTTPSFWWIFVLPVPVYLVLTYYMTRSMSKHQDELNAMAETSGRTLFDGVMNVRSVKFFGKEDEETERYAQRWSGYHQHEYRLEKLEFRRTSVQNVIQLGMRVILIIFCFNEIVKGRMSVGTMVMLTTYQGLLFGPMSMFNGMFSYLKRIARKIAALLEIVDEGNPFADKPGAAPLPGLRREIVVRNVRFRYGKAPALDNVSFTIPAGTTTALVGRSGSGKSTMSMLLLRIYEPASGSILWDGTDLRDVTRKSLREQVVIVPQDTSLFNRSVAENIAYGMPDADMREIAKAAKAAHAHEFIVRLPKGYRTVIGERGVKLSGGQRQRIAIARALLMDPSLLILDESTSHLDSESEKAIQASIEGLHHKTTQVIIAHRLSTIKHADQIIVLDKGRIADIGTHDALLKRSAIYKTLYSLQFS